MSHLFAFCFAKLRRAFRESQNPRKLQKKTLLLYHKHCFLYPVLFLMLCLLSAHLEPTREAEQDGGGRVMVAGKVSCHLLFQAMNG